MDPSKPKSQYWRPFPRVVRIEPAAVCNLSCSHCPTGTVDMVRGIIQPETFSMVVKNIKANIGFVKVVVLYHGGEPLLNKAFPSMAKSIKELGVPFVKTVSNGMLLREDQITGLIESGLDAIEFSLDGESPEQNNFIRRDCDYETVIKNIKRLIDAKRSRYATSPKIFIATTQFVKKDIYFKGQRAPIPDFLLREFVGEYEGEIAAFKCAFAYRWPHMNIDENIYELYHDPYDEETNNYCDHVENTITVRWNGDVVACCYDLTSQYVLGNIHQDDLATIWNNSRYLYLRESIEKREFVTMCDNCNVVKPNVFLTLKPEVRARLGDL